MLANLALAATSVVLVFGGAEAVFRRLNVAMPFYIGPAPWNCSRRDARMGLVFLPSCTGDLSDTPLRTNVAGLRGPEIRDDGSRRVLAIGDSCTWGWRVEEAESYPAQLQMLLDARRKPRSYQVLNGGVPGYTSLQGLRFLEDRGRSLRPEIVLAGFLWNDLSPGPDSALVLSAQPPPRLSEEANQFLLGHSRLFLFATVWWQVNMTAVNALVEQPHKVPPARYAENLAAIVTRARALGAKPLLIDWNLGGDASYRAAYGPAMARVADEHDVPLVTYEGPRLDLVHPTPEGYAQFATRLVDALEAARLLDVDRPGSRPAP